MSRLPKFTDFGHGNADLQLAIKRLEKQYDSVRKDSSALLVAADVSFSACRSSKQ